MLRLEGSDFHWQMGESAQSVNKITSFLITAKAEGKKYSSTVLLNYIFVLIVCCKETAILH
jgi:hypothetical protein